METAAAPPGSSSQGAAGAAAQPDPLSGQQALQAGAPMGNGVVSAAPAPAAVQPVDGGGLLLLPIDPLERTDAAPVSGGLLAIAPLSVGDETSVRQSQPAAVQHALKAEAPPAILPIAGLDLSSAEQPGPAAQPLFKAEQLTPPAPALSQPETELQQQHLGISAQPPQLQQEQQAASSKAEVTAQRSVTPAPAAVNTLLPAQPVVAPAPVPVQAARVSQEQLTLPAPGYLPIPGPTGGTLPPPDPVSAPPSSAAHQASPAPGLLPPPRPGLQRVNSQSPAIRPGLQPANPALVAAAHPGMVPSPAPPAAATPYPGAPLSVASAGVPPTAQPAYGTLPQATPAYLQPQQTQQQPPGQPIRQSPPLTVAAAAPAAALAMPPGFGFTAGQLTCLRQQIMTFRKLKVRSAVFTSTIISNAYIGGLPATTLRLRRQLQQFFGVSTKADGRLPCWHASVPMHLLRPTAC